MFLTIAVILIGIAYFLTCAVLIGVSLLVIIMNHVEHKDQGDAPYIGAACIFCGILMLVFGLAVITGEISVGRDGYTPTQGCWSVTTTRELVGKVMTDVRHWESISCP